MPPIPVTLETVEVYEERGKLFLKSGIAEPRSVEFKVPQRPVDLHISNWPPCLQCTFGSSNKIEAHGVQDKETILISVHPDHLEWLETRLASDTLRFDVTVRDGNRKVVATFDVTVPVRRVEYALAPALPSPGSQSPVSEGDRVQNTDLAASPDPKMEELADGNIAVDGRNFERPDNERHVNRRPLLVVLLVVLTMAGLIAPWVVGLREYRPSASLEIERSLVHHPVEFQGAEAKVAGRTIPIGLATNALSEASLRESFRSTIDKAERITPKADTPGNSAWSQNAVQKLVQGTKSTLKGWLEIPSNGKPSGEQPPLPQEFDEEGFLAGLGLDLDRWKLERVPYDARVPCIIGFLRAARAVREQGALKRKLLDEAAGLWEFACHDPRDTSSGIGKVSPLEHSGEMFPLVDAPLAAVYILQGRHDLAEGVLRKAKAQQAEIDSDMEFFLALCEARGGKPEILQTFLKRHPETGFDGTLAPVVNSTDKKAYDFDTRTIDIDLKHEGGLPSLHVKESGAHRDYDSDPRFDLCLRLKERDEHAGPANEGDEADMSAFVKRGSLAPIAVSPAKPATPTFSRLYDGYLATGNNNSTVPTFEYPIASFPTHAIRDGAILVHWKTAAGNGSQFISAKLGLPADLIPLRYSPAPSVENRAGGRVSLAHYPLLSHSPHFEIHPPAASSELRGGRWDVDAALEVYCETADTVNGRLGLLVCGGLLFSAVTLCAFGLLLTLQNRPTAWPITACSLLPSFLVGGVMLYHNAHNALAPKWLEGWGMVLLCGGCLAIAPLQIWAARSVPKRPDDDADGRSPFMCDRDRSVERRATSSAKWLASARSLIDLPASCLFLALLLCDTCLIGHMAQHAAHIELSGTFVGWLIGLGVLVWAAWEVLRVLRNILGRQASVVFLLPPLILGLLAWIKTAAAEGAGLRPVPFLGDNSGQWPFVTIPVAFLIVSLLARPHLHLERLIPAWRISPEKFEHGLHKAHVVLAVGAMIEAVLMCGNLLAHL